MNKALLLILDGYGINSKKYGNAIAAANTPNLDKFHTQYTNRYVISCNSILKKKTSLCLIFWVFRYRVHE